MFTTGHPYRHIIRPYVIPLLSLAVGLFLILGLVLLNARFTVASGEMTDDLGYYTYGYEIEQYYVGNRFKLRFWSTRGFEFFHKAGQMTVEKVEQRWLKSNAAVYLNLQVKYHDSAVSTRPVRVIFDFHRGEIYCSSDFTLWRNFDQRHESDAWMSDAEFDDVLFELEK